MTKRALFVVSYFATAGFMCWAAVEGSNRYMNTEDFLRKNPPNQKYARVFEIEKTLGINHTISLEKFLDTNRTNALTNLARTLVHERDSLVASYNSQDIQNRKSTIQNQKENKDFFYALGGLALSILSLAYSTLSKSKKETK
ncbi:hypothetical protein HYT23_02115 [Candidatus Pacearchaeota archaeon]|nr:hypothetical protein [Candidatus Pacearchaeota archaeon]